MAVQYFNFTHASLNLTGEELLVPAVVRLDLTSMYVRYAIYHAPDPGSGLHRMGSRWLGRDSVTGEAFAPPALDGLDARRVDEITAQPRVYGFHATLKPPFVLREGFSADDLLDAAGDFARRREAFEAPPLRPAAIGGFLALVLSADCPPMENLAADCVRDFDRFRAAPTGDELRKRSKAALSGRQLDLLQQWGYPYVLDEWQFHMTLTSRLEQPERDLVKSALDPFLRAHCESEFRVDAIAIFGQPAPGEPFVQLRRFSFA